MIVCRGLELPNTTARPGRSRGPGTSIEIRRCSLAGGEGRQINRGYHGNPTAPTASSDRRNSDRGASGGARAVGTRIIGHFHRPCHLDPWRPLVRVLSDLKPGCPLEVACDMVALLSFGCIGSLAKPVVFRSFRICESRHDSKREDLRALLVPGKFSA